MLISPPTKPTVSSCNYSISTIQINTTLKRIKPGEFAQVASTNKTGYQS